MKSFSWGSGNYFHFIFIFIKCMLTLNTDTDTHTHLHSQHKSQIESSLYWQLYFDDNSDVQEVPGKRFKGEDTWVIGRNGKTNSSRAFTWTPEISFTLVFGLDSDSRSVLCQFQWLLLSVIRQHGESKRRLGLGVRKNGQHLGSSGLYSLSWGHS